MSQAPPGVAVASASPAHEVGGRRIKRLRRNLKLTGAIIILSVGVLVPVLLSSAVGIITLVIGESSGSIVLGVLSISFAAAAIGSGIILTVLLGSKAQTARLQADLLANVTHELRTPLSAIRMYAQTLQLGLLEQDPERTRASLETIIRETDWLETMIDRVLTWRAAAKDRLDLELVADPLGPAIERAAKQFQRMLAPGAASFQLQLASDRPVRHDSRAITSVVLNLLINAYKYTGQDKQITLELRDVGKRVAIMVKDNGIGIPPKEHGPIFDPFYRVDSRLKGQASGVGLGLAIVRHLTQAHGGEVFVDSSEGAGSCFTILLPHASQSPG